MRRREFITLIGGAAATHAALRWPARAEASTKRPLLAVLAGVTREPNDLDTAFKLLSNEHVQAVVILADAMLFQERERVAELAAAARLPAVYGFRDHVDAGGLISYGVNYPENFRRAAIYVVKILKGAKPSDLPVEFPNKLELINQPQGCESAWTRYPTHAYSPRRRGDRVVPLFAALHASA